MMWISLEMNIWIGRISFSITRGVIMKGFIQSIFMIKYLNLLMDTILLFWIIQQTIMKKVQHRVIALKPTSEDPQVLLFH